MSQVAAGGPFGSGGGSMSAHQIAVELGKLIAATESSGSVDSAHFGAVLSDAGYALLRLKEQLSRDRSGRMAAEFNARRAGGVDQLLRVLVNLQRILNGQHAALRGTQAPKGFSLVPPKGGLNNASALSNRRRKAAVAEADCLECIKLMVQSSPAGRMILDYPSNLELIIMSLNSPQLDSKCYSIEILLLILDNPGGYSALNKSLSYTSGRNRDDSRLSMIIEQLKHGLHTSKLHIQVLVMRLLNKVIATAPNVNHRILTQIEAENAGLNIESLERIAAEFPNNAGADQLQHEVDLWRRFYSPLNWLERSPPSAGLPFAAAANSTAGSSRQSSFGRPPYAGERRSGPPMFINPPIDEYRASTHSDDDTIRSDRSRRLFEGSPQYRQKYNLNAPVVKNVQKTKRITPTKRSDNRRTTLGSAVSYPDFLPSHGYPRAKASFGDDASVRRQHLHRSVDNLSHPPPPSTVVRRGVLVDDRSTPMRRAKSETALVARQGGRGLPVHHHQPLQRPASTFTQLAGSRQAVNGGGGARLRRAGSGSSVERAADASPPQAPAPLRRSPKSKGLSQSVHNLHQVERNLPKSTVSHRSVQSLASAQPTTLRRTQVQQPLTIRPGEYRKPEPQHRRLQRPKTPTERTDEIIRNISPRSNQQRGAEQTRTSPPQTDSSRANARPAAPPPKKPAVRMQGFSYLFPEQPFTDSIPLKPVHASSPLQTAARQHRHQRLRPQSDVIIRPLSPILRAQSPSPLAAATSSSSYVLQHQPATNEMASGRHRRVGSPTFHAPPPPQASPPLSTAERRRSAEVIYLPIRLQGTDQVIQRRQRYYQPTGIEGYPSTSHRRGSPPSERSAYSTSTRRGGGDGASSLYSTTDSRRSTSPPKRHSGTASDVYPYGGEDDVRDALARFDYLNDYETGSSRA